MTSAATKTLRERNQMVIAKTMTEDELQALVIAEAQRLGWRVVHIRPAMMAKGRWVTPIEGDVGYPDLTLAKAGRAPLFFELKSEMGRFRDGQQEWLEALGPNAYCFRPHSWLDGTIQKVLA